MIVLLLPMFVEGRFIDSIEDLLLGRGPHHVACFRHGDAVRTVTLYYVVLDKTREKVVAEQLLMVDPFYLIMVG
jgi:hypothetical protein